MVNSPKSSHSSAKTRKHRKPAAKTQMPSKTSRGTNCSKKILAEKKHNNQKSVNVIGPAMPSLCTTNFPSGQRYGPPIAKTTFCTGIGMPNPAHLTVKCNQGRQWEFVQRINDVQQLHWYINRFSLLVQSRSSAGRYHFICKNGCPFRMLYDDERQSLYQHAEHNHVLLVPEKRRPIKLLINLRNEQAKKQQGHFELHSLAAKIKLLTTELGLEFREERGRFLLILPSSSSDEKENCSTSSVQIKNSVKWLVLADKRSMVRCSEYSRERAHDTTGEDGGLLEDGRLIEGDKECWKKWGRIQFMRLVRTKCEEYFFGKTNFV